MGATYPYMVLKLGFGPNVSVVAAFLGFLFLRIADLRGGTHYDRWQNNLVEAAGTSAAQTAFMCVLLGAFDLLHHNTNGAVGIRLTPGMSFLWLATACTLGVLLAVPLRRHFVVDEKLAYPDGPVAGDRVHARRAARRAAAPPLRGRREAGIPRRHRGGRDHHRAGPAARGQRNRQAQRAARVQGGDVGGGGVGAGDDLPR
jgi:uncharacterized oligopeptide transporter (OPT) family protein